MSFLDKFKLPSFGKKKEAKKQGFISKSISNITNGVRKGIKTAEVICKNVKNSPVKTTMIIGGSVMATSSSVAAEQQKAYQEFIKPTVAIEAPLKAVQPAFQLNKVVAAEGVISYEIKDVRQPKVEPIEPENNTVQITESDIKIAHFESFMPNSFVQHEGEFYLVKKTTTKVLTLQNIKDPEGAPVKYLKATDNPNIQPAYAQDIIASLNSYVAQSGMNATEIAHALGLKKWQKKLIFSLESDKIFDDDTDVDANKSLYALPDPNVVQKLFDQFQEHLDQFVIGDKYVFNPDGAQILECEIISVKDGNLRVKTEYHGKLAKFKITPQDWKRVTFKKIADMFKDIVNDDEKIKAVYEWVTDSIHNLSYSPYYKIDRNQKDNNNPDGSWTDCGTNHGDRKRSR